MPNETDNKNKMVSVLLRKPQIEWLESLQKKKGLMKSEVIRGLIAQEMDKLGLL